MPADKLPPEYDGLSSKDRREIRRILERFEAIPKRCSKMDHVRRNHLKLKIAAFRRAHMIGVGPVPAIEPTTTPSDPGGTRG